MSQKWCKKFCDITGSVTSRYNTSFPWVIPRPRFLLTSTWSLKTRWMDLRGWWSSSWIHGAKSVALLGQVSKLQAPKWQKYFFRNLFSWVFFSKKRDRREASPCTMYTFKVIHAGGDPLDPEASPRNPSRVIISGFFMPLDWSPSPHQVWSHSGRHGGGVYKVDFFLVFLGGLDSLGINELRTHGAAVRTHH